MKKHQGTQNKTNSTQKGKKQENTNEQPIIFTAATQNNTKQVRTLKKTSATHKRN